MTLQAIKENLIAVIEKDNGLSLDDFFSPLLEYYYDNEDVFGVAGDFITSPDISPVLGVLLGLRINAQKTEKEFHLLELGAGRGTMMRDMLHHAPQDFLDGLRATIIERSNRLAQGQKKNLQPCLQYLTWHRSMADVANCSVDFIVANEFFDCLLPRQFMLQDKKWRERLIQVDKEKNFCFAFAPCKDRPPSDAIHYPPKENVIYEQHQGYRAMLAEVARVLKPGGIITIIDYGNDGIYDGDTMQAIYRHQPVTLLAHLGKADISAAVAFREVAAEAKDEGLEKIYFDSQRHFLQNLHGDKIAEKLIALGYDKEQTTKGYQRLINSNQATDMGRLFKIMELQKQ